MSPVRVNPVDAARRELTQTDTYRERYERQTKVQQLSRNGVPQNEIAAVLRIHKRQVARDLAATVPEPPRLYNAALANNKRIQQLEASADLVLELAAVLRDEDPAIVWGALTRLSRRQLQEMLVIALAVIPTDNTPSELFHWVTNLPAAQAERQNHE